MSTNVVNAEVLQSEKNAKFTVVRDFSVVEFYGNLINTIERFGWNIDDVYATLGSHAQA